MPGFYCASLSFFNIAKNTPSSVDIINQNPFRFSSEFHDPELGLVYYNYRHYSPTDGRWLSRDPIEEQGGLNLYVFIRNRLVNLIDVLGNGNFDDFFWNGVSIKVGANGELIAFIGEGESLYPTLPYNNFHTTSIDVCSDDDSINSAIEREVAFVNALSVHIPYDSYETNSTIEDMRLNYEAACENTRESEFRGGCPSNMMSIGVYLGGRAGPKWSCDTSGRCTFSPIGFPDYDTSSPPDPDDYLDYKARGGNTVIISIRVELTF